MTRSRVSIALGVWLLLWTALWATDASPAGLLLGAVVVAAAATISVIVDLAREVCDLDWTQRPPSASQTISGDPLVTSLRQQVRGATWAGSSVIHDRLVDAIDERLLVHHRIDRAADPAAAMAVLTPRLRRIVGGQRRRDLVPNELRQAVADIESL